MATHNLPICFQANLRAWSSSLERVVISERSIIGTARFLDDLIAVKPHALRSLFMGSSSVDEARFRSVLTALPKLVELETPNFYNAINIFHTLINIETLLPDLKILKVAGWNEERINRRLASMPTRIKVTPYYYRLGFSTALEQWERTITRYHPQQDIATLRKWFIAGTL